MTPITYMSEQPTDYAAMLDDADTLSKLTLGVYGWLSVAPDAYEVVAKMGEKEFREWRAGLRVERAGDFAGENFAKRFGAVLMPEELIKVSMVAMKYQVPWGCAYLRLKESSA